MPIRPCSDYVRAELEPACERQRNGIVRVSPDAIRTARAVAVGPGKRTRGGVRIAVGIEPGERFAFFMAVTETRAGRALTQRAQELSENEVIVRANDILFVIETGDIEVGV